MTEHRGKRILVVDDHAPSLYATSRMLTAAGFDVVQAPNGTDALAAVAQGDIDGFEVCRRIRQDPGRARLPIVHLSATFVDDIDKVHGYEAGADGYLTHPVEPAVLIATVNSFLAARMAEEAQRRSDDKFRALFEEALDGVCLFDEAFVFADVNPALCRAMGRAREELIGHPLVKFVTPGFDLAPMHREIEERRQWKGLIPLLCPHGSALSMEWSISVHSTGMRLAIVADVTERSRLEAERETLLERERAARADAERANKVKDDFLATLSHELRSPLNAIVGWVEVLRLQAGDNKELAEGLAVILRNAKFQAQIISDLLDVSRIMSGKLQLEPELVEVTEIMQAVLHGVARAADAKQVTVETKIEPEDARLYGDPARLQQILSNLVGNAVKFSGPAGRVRVLIQAQGDDVRISVADEGLGIAATDLPFIFERFWQQDTTTRRSHGGLGLGLAIVRHLTELHGGSVVAESAGEGKGATFTVKLPAGQPGSTSSLAPDRDLAGMLAAGRNLEGVRVLIVDDDTDSRQWLRRIVTWFRADVRDVSDAAQALEAVERFRPHVLLSDIAMPHQDGFDLVKAVRRLGHSADELPAIALTAFATAEDKERAMKAGFQAFLSKPLEPRDLLATVVGLLPRD